MNTLQLLWDDVWQVVVAGLVARGVATEEDVRGWAGGPAVDAAGRMVDAVLARARAERSG